MKKILILLCAMLLSMGMFGVANAATIEFLPQDIVTTHPDTFLVEVVGRNFDPGTNGSTSGGTAGGGLTINWNPAVLTLDGFVLDFSGDQGLAPPPSSGPGTLSFSVSSFFITEPNPNFGIADLTFSTVAPGFTNTSIVISAIDVWPDADGIVDMTPGGVGGTVTVNDGGVIPIPGTALLFGSGLLGIVAIGRKKRS
jgi:hypothetical protein